MNNGCSIDLSINFVTTLKDYSTTVQIIDCFNNNTCIVIPGKILLHENN